MVSRLRTPVCVSLCLSPDTLVVLSLLFLSEPCAKGSAARG